MAITNLSIPYPDFKLHEVIDPEQFDFNNKEIVEKMNIVLGILNQITDAVVDGGSGADKISLTPITGFTSTKLQAYLEEVVAKLTSSTGAGFIGTTALAGVAGSTLGAQLSSLKSLIDVEKARITSLEGRMGTAEGNIANRYTKAEVDTKDSALQSQITSNANISNGLQTQINTHTHDSRYMTRAELTPYLQGGDTAVKEEVFTIVTSNNGDGTFTYKNRFDVQRTGTIGTNGEQIFTLEDGNYMTGLNHAEAIINDTLRRSVASGGLIEKSTTSFAIANPEGVGTEITVKYFERLGVSGEHNIVYSVTIPPPTDGFTMWFKVVG